MWKLRGVNELNLSDFDSEHLLELSVSEETVGTGVHLLLLGRKTTGHPLVSQSLHYTQTNKYIQTYRNSRKSFQSKPLE